MDKETLDAAGRERTSHSGGVGSQRIDETDEESEESFPASDPPSTWAGDGPAADHPRHGDVSDRVVERSPVEHVPERDNPDDPVPGTLPRE